MRQFGYTQTIPRHHVVSAPPALTYRQINDMFADFESHLVSEETRSIIAVNNWSYVEWYTKWFFRLSHSYMVHAAPGDPTRPTHQEILEKEQTQLDHAKDVLPRRRRIMEILQADIYKDIFLDESDVR
ncbi:uncharacterized protein LOC127095527 [Lathyrus oleraceus]|uniref:uncharacterized protein LOC127095527 n=1 Tax=Pisum sativum TaxID=3888 RepID=UPI0021D18B3E|nr:uncharacterized protein LOC127095527 [Pisum sativum]